MFAIMLAAFLSDASSPAPAPASSAPVAALREIVYKYSLDRTTDFTSASFDSAAQTNMQNAGYSGSMTIDVVQVDGASGALKVDVSDRTNAENDRGGSHAVFLVQADGTILAQSQYDADMPIILPYVATAYFAGHDLQQGAQWEQDSQIDGVDYETMTTVAAVAGDDATITSTTKAKKGQGNGSLEVETKLVYQAKKLVPISLDIEMRRNGSGDTASAEQTTHYRFDRVSDTLDQPAGH